MGVERMCVRRHRLAAPAEISHLCLVQTIMKANTRIHEHSAPGSISVQTISGHIRMQVVGREFDLPASHLLALDSAVPYDMEALEDSAFALTIAWRGEQERH